MDLIKKIKENDPNYYDQGIGLEIDCRWPVKCPNKARWSFIGKTSVLLCTPHAFVNQIQKRMGY